MSPVSNAPAPARRDVLALQKDMRDQQAKSAGPTLGEFYGQFQGLPGLRGLWYPGSQDQSGAIYDQSGQARTLTFNGNPTLNIYNDLVPYEDYDGAGDFHNRANEAGLQISGIESAVSASIQGLTWGGIWYPDSVASAGLLSKTTTGGQGSYRLDIDTGAPRAIVYGDGTDVNAKVASAPAVAAGAWYFILGRFIAGTSVAVCVNGVWTTKTTSIPASLFNSSAGLTLGALNAGATYLLNGRCALAFLAAAAWDDVLVNYLFNRARVLFAI